MKSLPILAFALLLHSPSIAQLHQSNLSATHHYTGVIGGKYKFLMNLYFDKENIEGVYRYYTQKEFLQLKGTYNTTTKKFNLTESIYDWKKQQSQVTGYFEGVRDGNTVTGKWFNTDRTKTFDFVLSTDEKPTTFTILDNSKPDGDWVVTDTISIADNTGTKQIITGFKSEVMPDFDFINLEDINFDGYLDLLIVEMTGARNTPYLYWVYDASSRKFIRHDELTANDPVVDVQHQRIVCDWTGGAALHGQAQYIYQDGKFYLIEETETDYSINKTTITKYKIENGKRIKL